MTKKKRTLSEEQKKKMAEGKARAAAERAAAASQEQHGGELMDVPAGVVVPKHQPSAPAAPVAEAEDEQVVVSSSVLKQVLAEMEQIKRDNAELMAALANNDPGARSQAFNHITGMQGAMVSAQGVQGQVFKYPVEKSHYPDPTDRLYDDPKLRRFAMRENFYFKWDVEGETYEKHGITYTEPRFIVELWRFMFDPETGEPTGKMFLISRQMQHEDEFAARVAAEKLGLSFDNVQDLLDEMRYQRIRQWLIGVFTPNRVNTHKNKVTQMVVGGKVVEVKDSEVLTDKNGGIGKSEAINSEIQLTPAETREAVRQGLLKSA